MSNEHIPWQKPANDDRLPAGVARRPGIALMITRAQRAALRTLGVSDARIGTMTPTEAHEILLRGDARNSRPSGAGTDA